MDDLQVLARAQSLKDFFEKADEFHGALADEVSRIMSQEVAEHAIEMACNNGEFSGNTTP